MRTLGVPGLSRTELLHAARTTLAAALSLIIAEMLHLPEPQWAAISTIVVTQSTLGGALTISGQRFVGTALGATVGALLAPRVPPIVIAFAAGMLLLGVVCTVARLDHAAYRFAGITLVIVLASRGGPVWTIATHRFFEVSLGIATGLVMAWLWPEREPAPGAASG